MCRAKQLTSLRKQQKTHKAQVQVLAQTLYRKFPILLFAARRVQIEGIEIHISDLQSLNMFVS